MDTSQNAAEVPSFKLAKVGERKRRKGAVWPWSSGMRAGVNAISGAGASAAMSGAQVAVVAIALALGVGAYTVGKSLRPEQGNPQARKKPQLFAQQAKPKYEGDLSKLPGAEQNQARSGLGMVSGSLDGLTPEERAAKAKAEADAAKAAAEAQAKADAAQDQAAPAGKAVDPAAMVAAATASAEKDKEKKNSFNSKFGELSKKFGGGAGLSGGISRGFDAPKLNGGSGKLLAMAASRPAVVQAGGRAAAVGVGSGGRAQRQLGNAAAWSKQARNAGVKEAAASYNATSFDNSAPGGSFIASPGGGESGTPKASKSDSNTGNNQPMGGGQEASAPETTNTPTCSAQETLTDGVCVPNQGHSVDPTDGIAKTAETLMITYAILSAFLFACVLLANSGVPIAQWLQVVIRFIKSIMVYLAAAIGLLGVTLISMGRADLGILYTVEGAALAVMAYEMQRGPSMAVFYWMLGGQTILPILSELCTEVHVKGRTLIGNRSYNSTTQKWQ